MDGSKSGHDVISSVVDAVIHPSVQAMFTWTGKTNNKEIRKEKFSDLNEIHGLILCVCRKADHTYSKSDFMDDLIYKVIKYAYNRWYALCLIHFIVFLFILSEISNEMFNQLGRIRIRRQIQYNQNQKGLIWLKVAIRITVQSISPKVKQRGKELLVFRDIKILMLLFIIAHICIVHFTIIIDIIIFSFR